MCGGGRPEIDSMLPNLMADTPWDVIFLQELSAPMHYGPIIPDWIPESVEGESKSEYLFTSSTGHLVIYGTTPWRCCGLVLHRRHLSCLSRSVVSQFPTAILASPTGLLAFTSAHLPASHYSQEHYVFKCAELRDFLLPFSHNAKLFLGMDANVHFPASFSEAVGPHTLGGTAGLREVCIASMAESFNLRFCNTWNVCPDPGSSLHTHVPWNGSSHGQIDFLLAPKDCPVGESWTFPVPCATDHRAVAMTVPMSFPEARRSYRKSAKSWFMPAGDDEGALAAREGFSEQVLGDLRSLAVNGEESSLGEFANAVAGAARVHGSYRTQGGGSGITHASKLELRELERKRRVTSSEDERASLSKQIWCMRRQHKRARTQASLDHHTRTGRARQWRQSTHSATATSLDENGDRSTWPGFLSEYFRGIFSVTSPEHNVWRLGLLDRIRERADSFSQNPELNIVFSVDEVLGAIGALKPNKACADDGVSAEMLQSLPREAVLFLACSFSARASGGGEMGDPSSWQNLSTLLLPKVPRVKQRSQLRPITILPVLKKLYSTLLLSRVSPYLTPLLSPWNLGCRKGYQALELISVVKWSIEKCQEWHAPLWVVKLDFRKAFDSLTHPSLHKTLRDAGVPDEYVVAVLRELLGVQLSLRYGDVVSHKILALIGVPQGDPGSPLYFSSTVDRLLRPLLAKWKANEIGFTMRSDDTSDPPVHLPLLAWMDDVYLFATSAEEAELMVREVCMACEPAGLCLQPTKCTWGTTAQDCTREISVRGETLRRLAPGEGLDVLGTLVSFTGDANLEHCARLAKAWRAFWANSALLLNPRVGVYRRLSLLNSVVAPSPLWGVGGAIHSQKQVQRYNATQNAMAAQILRTRRRAQEPWVDWFRRSRRTARDTLRRLGHQPWGTTLRVRVLTWAGHVARLTPDRLCLQALRWRNLAWWRKRQSLISLGLSGLRHPQGCFGRPRRWEEAAERCAAYVSERHSGSSDWFARAQDRDLWKWDIGTYYNVEL